jgi:hypothetical protein
VSAGRGRLRVDHQQLEALHADERNDELELVEYVEFIHADDVLDNSVRDVIYARWQFQRTSPARQSSGADHWTPRQQGQLVVVQFDVRTEDQRRLGPHGGVDMFESLDSR